MEDNWYDVIEQDVRMKPKDLKYAPGICKICGLHYDVLLKVHAWEHGFKDEYDMINQGYVYLDCDRYKEKRNATKRLKKDM